MKAIHGYDQTAFVVTSARGLDSERIGLSARALDDAVLAGGGDATYTASDTASFVGLRVSLQSQPVAQAIQQAQLRNVDAVYYRSGSTNSSVYKPQYLNPDVPASFSSALDYLLSTMTASYAPDVVVIYRPGTLVTVSNGSSPPRQAGSLGPQWPDQHIPLIVAGHGILPGRRSRFPARLVDIAPTVASLLGLHLAHTDGIILADAMIKPAGKDVAAQHSLARQLTPLVRALEQRGRSG
jgi:hypothetical protein